MTYELNKLHGNTKLLMIFLILKYIQEFGGDFGMSNYKNLINSSESYYKYKENCKKKILNFKLLQLTIKKNGNNYKDSFNAFLELK